MVTGGSDGIGLAMCKDLAKMGFNICIVGRNEEKIKSALEEIKIECSKTGNFKTKYILADFGRLTTITDYQTIAD